jgi:hypothetical protein
LFYELQEGITLLGRNIWGRQSEITFRPNDESVDEEKRLHWHWAPTLRHKPIPLSPAIAEYFMRQVQLTYGWRSLNCWEHLGALRYLFPCGITVIGEGWPPFHGGLHPYRERLLERSKPLRLHPVMYTVKETVGHPTGTHDTCQNLCRIRALDEPYPSFSIEMDYPGYVDGGFGRNVSVALSLDEMFRARILGHSKFNFHRNLAAFASMWGWPHFSRINWTGYDPDRSVSQEAVLDRAMQLLGLMSLLGGNGLFVADVQWKYSGLKADLEVIKLAESRLIPQSQDARLSAMFQQ